MTSLAAQIETLEHSFMRAWMEGDGKALKRLTSRNFRLVIGARPSVLLDSRSWLDGATSRFRCSAYRFGTIYSRDLDGTAVFATQLELEARLDGQDWSGTWWVTDIWRKGRLRRSWRLADRHLSRIEPDSRFPVAIKALQLWK
ncbi:nuclear transport factor 2 family protein [Sphingomonas sp. BN140010]|uniref:Nuclear transport factor 2 family protein n=1 Tax=Sphingomonas arvum TaxID=2992113 RepID=A0ABT3JII2_9SPHN|nr:nuclear transport factor 2 family protein [Sphingomonas sp. BN140010]MCW3798754.1 nuclear transport factor 2 family protein [Sphingomonas sp. BN140010]